MSRVSMEDVARVAGVSLATVSRVIHSQDKVRPATRRRVEEAMAELGYVYNSMAADFTRQRNSMIGLIIFTVKSSIHAQLIEGIQEELTESRYSLIIANSMYRADRELRFLRLFRERKLSGVIVAEATDENRNYIKELRNAGMPVVITWEMTDDQELDCVGIDNYAAAYDMTRYLTGLGHRNVGAIVGDYRNIERVRHRYRGYADALAEIGLSVREDYVVSAEPSPENGKTAMVQLLGRRHEPTAVLEASDAFAVGAIGAARELRLRVPEDVSIVGFDDVDIAQFCCPPLTTVRVPGFEMGQQAARALVGYERRETAGPTRLCLRTELLVRESASAPLAS